MTLSFAVARLVERHGSSRALVMTAARTSRRHSATCGGHMHPSCLAGAAADVSGQGESVALYGMLAALEMQPLSCDRAAGTSSRRLGVEGPRQLFDGLAGSTNAPSVRAERRG